MIEILIGSSYHNGSLYWLDASGALKWSYHSGSDVQEIIPADIYGNKTKELIFASKEKGIFALKANGQLLWSFDNQARYYYPPVVKDISGDDKPEILFFEELDTRNIVCLSAAGELQWQIPTFDIVNNKPAIYDINSDLKPEIIFRDYNMGLVCLDNTTTILATYKPKNGAGTSLYDLFINDFENDSRAEITYMNHVNIYLIQVFNRNLFYGVYLLPAYLLAIPTAGLLSYGAFKALKNLKLKKRRKIIKYLNGDGEEVYIEIKKEK